MSCLKSHGEFKRQVHLLHKLVMFGLSIDSCLTQQLMVSGRLMAAAPTVCSTNTEVAPALYWDETETFSSYWPCIKKKMSATHNHPSCVKDTICWETINCIMQVTQSNFYCGTTQQPKKALEVFVDHQGSTFSNGARPAGTKFLDSFYSILHEQQNWH